MLSKFIIGTCIIILMYFNVNESISTTQDSFLNRYQNSNYGIEMEYPDSWKLQESLLNDSLILSIENSMDKTKLDIEKETISSQSLPNSSYVLSLIRDDQLNFSKSLVNFFEFYYGSKLTETYDNITINGYPAFKLIYNDLYLGANLTTMEVGIIVNNKLFLLYYTAEQDVFNKNIDEVNSIINSIKFKRITEENNMITYHDPLNNFTINHPPDWIVNTTKKYWDWDQLYPYVTFLSNTLTNLDKYVHPGDINIWIIKNIDNPNSLAHQLPSVTKSLGDYVNFIINHHYHNDTNFDIKKINTNYTIDGYPAYFLIFENTESNKTIHNIEVGTIVGNTAYLIEYSADKEVFEINEEIAKRIIDSIKFERSYNPLSLTNKGINAIFYDLCQQYPNPIICKIASYIP